MYTKAIFYPYNLGSASAKALAQALATKCVRPAGRYRWRPTHLPINWGNSTAPQWADATVMRVMLNRPQQVALASDKIQTFRRLQEAMPNEVVPWTTDRRVALQWLTTPEYKGKLNAVVCRTLTRANSGRGIVLAKTAEEVVNAPLYTRYKPKKDEFRIHVSARFGVIDASAKLLKTGAKEAADFNPYIRSHHHGWIFARNGIEVPERVNIAAAQAIAAVGLDFGAVDIGWHPDFGISIYEINTAPGLEGQTLTNYTNMFQRYIRGN